jgi:hypothetical protein
LAHRPLRAPYWQYELWAWFTPAWATDGMMAVGTIILSDLAAPEDQAVATCVCAWDHRSQTSSSIDLGAHWRIHKHVSHNRYPRVVYRHADWFIRLFHVSLGRPLAR